MRVLLLATMLSCIVILGGCAGSDVNMDARQVSTAYTFQYSGAITWNVLNPPMDQYIVVEITHKDVPGWADVDYPPTFSHTQLLEEGTWTARGVRAGYVVTANWPGAPYFDVEGPGSITGLNFIVTEE